ncbi:hypothetical protein ES332_D13G132000v1 [Gossypium tomentosum]|uniref:Uncharacterized protein n=1 Tax=Gossypium tomentosum TaxID=34277 RepID=A0A5D2HWL6_GOSTO|nr:hypothetical protein ES332_D13G132000v1 [Gossypium tomentosum]
MAAPLCSSIHQTDLRTPTQAPTVTERTRDSTTALIRYSRTVTWHGAACGGVGRRRRTCGQWRLKA